MITQLKTPPRSEKRWLPELGLGCAALGNLYTTVTEDDARATISAAHDAGITYFDVAPLYGHGLAELRLGAGLRQLGQPKVIISTKVGWQLHPARNGITHAQPFQDITAFSRSADYSYDATMRSLENSLQRLGRSEIDIVLIHDVDKRTHGDQYDAAFKDAMRGAYVALEELRRGGTIKAIGVGVNEWEPCAAFADAGDFDCFLLAGRFTLLEQSALETFLPLCQQRQIDMIIGGVYNSGILAQGATPHGFYDYQRAPSAIVDRVRAIQRVCTAYQVSLKAAALQFPFRHPSIVSVIPGARSAEEVLDNAASLREVIPPAFWLALEHEGLLWSAPK